MVHGSTIGSQLACHPPHLQHLNNIQALGVKVATRSFNICKDLDLACPVPAGEHVVAKFKLVGFCVLCLYRYIYI